jgi:DNA (cytosine-5)-methyltransferase 1
MPSQGKIHYQSSASDFAEKIHGFVRTAWLRSPISGILASEKYFIAPNPGIPQYTKMVSKKQPKPTFIDIFAGCGGLSLGLMQAGWQGIFAVEKDAFAFETLKHNLVSNERDLKFKWPKWLPKKAHSVGDVLSNYKSHLEGLSGKVDLMVGGPPCQGFSNAGKRNPNDPRNKLVEYYLEFISVIKPKIVLIENVKGITVDFDDSENKSGKINYSKWILDSLAEKYTVFSKILDTSKFGVPQRRNRFFIIAVRNDLRGIETDPFDAIESDRASFLKDKGISSVPVSSRSAISDLEVSANGLAASTECVGFNEICYKKPSTSFQKLMNNDLDNKLTDTRLARHKPEIITRFKKIIKICQESGRLNISLSAEIKASLGLKKCAIRVLDPDNISPTITSMPDDLIHYSEPRILTVRENARLQSFPDWFAFKGKYTSGGERRKREVPRFTQVANAVPPLAAEAIGRTLLKQLTKLN